MHLGSSPGEPQTKIIEASNVVIPMVTEDDQNSYNNHYKNIYNNHYNNNIDSEEKTVEEWDKELYKKFIYNSPYRPQDIIVLAENYLWQIPKEARIYILEKYESYNPENCKKFKDANGNYVDKKEDSVCPVDEELPF